MTRRVSVLGLLMLVAGCGSSSAGGGTGGSGGGGALGGSGGHTGGTGGSSGSGGTGGHVGTGGAAGGSAGGGGVGGGAGRGSGGAGGFDCTGVSLDGDCSAYPTGLVCILAGEAPLPCVCVPASGGPKWQCDVGNPCPSTEGGGECSLSTITTIANLGGCKYPPVEVCSCEAADGGAAWSCNNAACPATPPTGSCAASPASGFSCEYSGTSISCNCASGDGGAPRWRCNGKATPDCPASWPGGGVDCSTFQPGTLCPYPAGNVTGGPCTCASNGTGLTWHCGNG